MPIILKNNAFSTLAAAIDASETTISVADGSQFPTLSAGEYFYATLVATTGETEIVKVTARTGDSLTVVRAQDDSSAGTFQSGSRIDMRVNAASVTDLVAEHDQATEISIVDAGGYYTGTDVEAALQEAAQAATTQITDAGGYYTGTTVEAALQEAAQASTIQITDAGGYYAGTTVEAALQEAAQSVTVLDEDDMASDSATAVPSQQSVKAYVDTSVSAVVSSTAVNEVYIDDYATINAAIAAMTEGDVLIGTAGTTYTPNDGVLSIPVKKFGIRSTTFGVPFTVDFSGNTLWYNSGLFKCEGAVDGTLVGASIDSTLAKGEAVQVTAGTYSSPDVTITTQYPHGYSIGDLVFVYSTASATLGQAAYLTMVDSDEGMALAIPVAVKNVVDPNTFTYEPLYNGTPDASLSNTYLTWTRKNDLWCDITDTTGWAKGDMVLIESSDTAEYYSGGVVIDIGEHNEVDFVDGGGLWLKRPVKNVYATTPIVSKINPVECGVTDMHIIGKGATIAGTTVGNADVGFRLRYARNCKIDISVADCDNMAAQIINSYNCEFPKVRTQMDRTNSGGALAGKIEYQYGLAIMNCCNHLHFGTVICEGGRHGPDESCLGAFGAGKATDITFDHVECYNQWSTGFDSHALGERWIVKYAKMQNNGGFAWRSGNITVLCLEAEYCDNAFYAQYDLRNIYVDVYKAKNCGYAGIRMQCTASTQPNPDNIDLRLRYLDKSQFGVRIDVHDNHIVTNLRIHEVNCKDTYNYPVNLRDFTGSNTGFEYRGAYIGRINANATSTLLVGKNCNECIFENFYAVEARAGSLLANFTGTNDNNQFRNMYGTLTGGGAIGSISLTGTGNRANGIVESQTITMAANAATIIWLDVPFVYIDTSGGAAENLNTLSGGATGGVYYVRGYSPSTRVVTLKDGADNIQCNTDTALNNSRLLVPLLYTGSEWNSIGTPRVA